jgi:hypothetical protein
MSYTEYLNSIKIIKYYFNILGRNINKMVSLRPEFFTKKLTGEYEKCFVKITKHIILSDSFFKWTKELFILLLKLLDDPINRIEGIRGNYTLKYSKRIKSFTKDKRANNVIGLIRDINDELESRINQLLSESVVAHNMNNVGVSYLNNGLNYPLATQINTALPATWRNFEPINYKRPLANAVLQQTQTNGNKLGNQSNENQSNENQFGSQNLRDVRNTRTLIQRRNENRRRRNENATRRRETSGIRI